MLKNLIVIVATVEIFVSSAAAVDFDLYAIGDRHSPGGSRILRYSPGVPPFPQFGLFKEVILEDSNQRTDLETDGTSLFTIETLASSGRKRLAKYSTDGTFLEELADVSFMSYDVNLMYQAGEFYASDVSDRLYRITPGFQSEIGNGIGGAGVDAFPGGFISTGQGGIRIFDDTGGLLSTLDLGLVLDGVAIDDENSIAYLSNLSSEWVVVDFSDPVNPSVVSQGTAPYGLFLSDFDPHTGNIFGSSLGVLTELKPDGTLASQYSGSPSGIKLGVAVVAVPEPASGLGIVLLLAASSRWCTLTRRSRAG